MLSAFWRRGRKSALASAAIAGTAAAVTAGAIAASPAHAGSLAQPRLAAARSAVPPLSAPWPSVGTGWVLAEYSPGTASKPAPTTLYLVSPFGEKYAVYQWAASKTAAPHLLAWSGDKTRALLQLSGPNQLEQLNLRTGKAARFSLPADVMPAGYTRPGGLQLLGEAVSDSAVTLGRYTLAGKRVQVLGQQADGVSAIYTPDGTELALSADTGLLLVSNTGRVISKLPVTAADPRIGCEPARWWNPGTILAECTPKGSAAAQLWLVPVNGAKPKALTPVRKSGMDLGDLDAWALPSGLYLQSAGACGTLELNKQARNGSIAPVPVPGLPAGTSVAVVTALGPQLLIHALGCTPGSQLVWFNPATKAERWLFKSGVESVIPYYSTENGTFS
jgi:TolB protein